MARVPFVQDIGGGRPTLLNCFQLPCQLYTYCNIMISQSEALTNDQCMAGWITVTRNFNLITPHFCTWLHLVSHKLTVVIDIEIWQWKAILGAFEHNWIISTMTITVNITMKSTEHRKSPLKIPQNWTWLEFLANWVIFWYNLVSSSLESGGQVVRQCQSTGGENLI